MALAADAGPLRRLCDVHEYPGGARILTCVSADSIHRFWTSDVQVDGRSPGIAHSCSGGLTPAAAYASARRRLNSMIMDANRG